MDENNNWNEINGEAKKILSKIKNKADTESTIHDLKSSLKSSITNMNSLMKELIDILESSISDEEIKEDSKKLVNSIGDELNMTINNIRERVFTANKDAEEE